MRLPFSQNEKNISSRGKFYTAGINLAAENQLVNAICVFGKLLVIGHMQQDYTSSPNRGIELRLKINIKFF